ncbi:transposase [Proteiniborus sp.]|uniref:transposase n=1 Tax=Proteiniborus sp. TaxID=2079015 RepID=UPI00332D0C62
MSRGPREKSNSGIYHIMLRGINRQTIFEDNEDRTKFLETLRSYKNISKYQIYGYCIMDNHVHILIKEVEESISMAMKRICASYVHWYSDKYERCGHLFQENPAKANMTKNIIEYKWTSYHEYIRRTSIVDIDFGFNLFSMDKKKATDLFIKFMNENNKDKCLDDEEKVRLSDNEVMDYINRLGIVNISILEQLDRDRRDEVIKILKKIEGVTIRQLSRITGISKSVIDRVR